MGIVCLAHDPVMGRDLALKTILLPHGLPEQEKYEFRQRFRREAQAAGRLSHPGIVTVYDYNESDEGLPYIAMEYVQGFTLHELIAKEGSLNPEWSVDMAATLADALDVAHAAGVIHRDLKPANILIRESDGAAKITDFGIARINTSDLTQAGTTYGSPAYMAPERIKGVPADARSDLFSLAVILYEALSGTRPFDGEDFTAICYAIVNEPPIPVRTRQPALSLAFDAFFRRALAKNPAERFQDGASFRQGLESVRHQQRMFESGSDTLKMMIPTPTAELESVLELREMGATPVPEGQASRPGVPWRWVAVGAGVVLLLLSSFIMGWVFSGGEQDGLVGVPLDLNKHPATVALADAVGQAEPSAPFEEPAALEVAPPSEPVIAEPEPAVVVAPEPTPAVAPATIAEAVAVPEPVVEPLVEPPAELATGELETTEATPEVSVEPAPVAVVPGPVPVNVRIKSSFKNGNLTLLVDGEEIESIPLIIDSAAKDKSRKKGSGKGVQELEMQIEILPGHHTITAVAYSAAKDREYTASLEFDLELGDMRTLHVVAGKTLGKRLTLKLK